MRRAAGMHVDLDGWIFLNQRTGGSGMVQMNVRQQDRAQVRYTQPLLFEPLPQIAERRGRAGINERHKVFRPIQGGGNAAWFARPVQIERRDCGHTLVSVSGSDERGSYNFRLPESFGSVTKYLQNDELVEYAFTAATCFFPPSASKASMYGVNRPYFAEKQVVCCLPSCVAVQRST